MPKDQPRTWGGLHASGRRAAGALTLACLALIAGMVVTTTATLEARRSVLRDSRSRFDHIAELATKEAARRANQVEHVLKGARGVYAASTSVTRDDFRAFASQCDFAKEFPGAMGVGFAERISRSEISAVEEDERSNGDPAFAVHGAPGHDDLYVIRYIEPLEPNRGAWGFDLGSEPNRREAIERAISTGEPTVSPPVKLVQDPEGRTGYLYLLPVFDSGSNPTTPAERFDRLRGLIYVPFIAAATTEGMAEQLDGMLDLESYDGTTISKASLLYDLDREPVGIHEQAGRARMFMTTRRITVGGRVWTLVLSTRPKFEATVDQSLPWVVAIGGSALSILSASVVWVLGSARRRAEELARSMTADLARARDRAESALREVSALRAGLDEHAIISVADKDGRITYANRGFCAISGFTQQELVGSDHRILNSGEHPREFWAAMWAQLKQGKAWRGEICNRRKDGPLYWVDSTIVPFMGADGTLEKYVSIRFDVTAQRAAAEHSARLAAIVNSTEDAIVSKTLDGVIRSWNPGAERLFGYKAEDVIGKSIRMLLPEDRGGEEDHILERVFQGDVVRNLETKRVRADGKLVDISVSISPIRDSNGRIVGASKIARDISERKSAEDEARRSAGVLRRMGNVARVGGWELDLESNHLSWTDEVYRIHELPPGTPVTVERAIQYYAPDAQQTIADAVRLGKKEGKPWDLVLPMVTAKGRAIWVRAQGEAVQREGRVVALCGAFQDVTEQFLAAEAVRERELRLRAIYEAEPECVKLVGRRGELLDMNPAGLSLIEADSLESVMGLDTHKLITPEYRERYKQSIDQAFRGETSRIEFEIVGLKGTRRWMEQHAVGLRNPRDPSRVTEMLAVARDITDRKRAESELVEARRQAEAANQSKSEFLANMSHEIRTPMTAILGYADLLLEDGDTNIAPKRRLENIDTIKRNGEHLLSIINDILDISKIEAGKMTVEMVRTSPAQIVSEVLALMDVKARAKGLMLSAAYRSLIPETITCDPVRLRQILVNLVGNAIKFTEIGHIKLTTSLEPSTGLMRFDVEDTGIGLSEDQVGKLFEAFVQADTSTTRKFGGTGLGLRISKRLARMLGGDIAVRSTLGVGSVFSLTVGTGDLSGIAMIDAAASAALSAQRPTVHLPVGDTPLDGKRVLLAEDGPDNVRLISFHLRKAGATVIIAENGRQAVEALCQGGSIEGALIDPPPVDLIVTDMQMPEMDGYAATTLLRQKGCQLPIVALTAHAMSGDMERCKAAGCDLYASKPVDKNNLLRVCLQALATRQGQTDDAAERRAA